jgi:Lysozyme like domain
VTRLLVAAAAVVLLPVVLLAAAVGALRGGADPTVPVGARGAVGLAVAAAQAGFSGQGLRLAVAVGLAESGGNPTARGPNPPTPGCPAGSTDRGAWQLNNCYHPEVADACADDLACAARETYRISAAGSDWREWTTYTSGAYQAQLAAADQALATLPAPSTGGDVPPGYGTPGPCGLSPAADYAKHLVTALFGITDIGGCALFSGHITDSDHYPDANGQAHAIDVMVGTNSALGWQVATWAAANAAALHVKYVIFAGQIIDFREPAPAWHACRDPSSSCAVAHFQHVHLSFEPNA